MAQPALFIGVVSHEGSRFTASQGPTGLAASLRDRLEDMGLPVEVLVNTADLYNPEALPITRTTVQRSLTEQQKLDKAWARYLGHARGPRWLWHRALRRARRAQRFFRSPPQAVVRRLVNIELSHLVLMRRGLDSQADWTLILEDDAATTDLEDCAAGLVGLLRGLPRPDFVNISRSFSPEALGIDHLLSPVEGQSWSGAQARSIQSAATPVTNTVCAILYSRSFLLDLVPVLEDTPLDPVVPIDWKLNAALMRMSTSHRAAPITCWLVEPAPIVQQSMWQ